MRVHFQTLGCRLNEAELESWSRDFQALGHRLARGPEEADLLVVNTCAVTQEAVRKSRHLLRRVQAGNPTARLVVTGCYAALHRDEAKALGVDLVIDNRDKDRLAEIAARELDLGAMPSTASHPEIYSLLAQGRQRAFLKIQDGCRHRCSYCIITVARGEERSRPVRDLVDEINRLGEEGIGEVVLTGVHIGGYGNDLGTSLVELLRAILTDTEMPRVRIGSLEPWDLDERLWSLFGARSLMPHLHLPLQSGADSVLRRMARRTRAAQFERLVGDGRSRVPDLNVTTDIIVGFPGETDDEWRRTTELVERLGLGHVHIFAYSPRPGTKAAALPDTVPAAVKRARGAELHALERRSRAETLARFVGRTLPVLVESPQPGWEGYTPNFLRVKIDAPRSAGLEGQIIDVRLEAVDDPPGTLLGRPVP